MNKTICYEYSQFHVNRMQTLYKHFFSLPWRRVISYKMWDRCLPSLPIHAWLSWWNRQPSQCGSLSLVLVNAIAAVTHKAFVFHHAHPLSQPASLSPGIIYPQTEHMGPPLCSLLLSYRGATLRLIQSRRLVFWARWRKLLPPPIGLKLFLIISTGCPGCMPFDTEVLLWDLV